MDYKHSELLYPGSKQKMELDIFVPKLNLALEYQGEHHYLDHFVIGSPEEQIRRFVLVFIIIEYF